MTEQEKKKKPEQFIPTSGRHNNYPVNQPGSAAYRRLQAKKVRRTGQ